MPALKPSRYAAFNRPSASDQFAKKWQANKWARPKSKAKIDVREATESVKEPKEQHCIRCHATFYVYEGGANANASDVDEFATKCTIPHVYRDDPIYLMGGDFTYASDCCGESATITELGIGTGNFEISSAGAEPCFVGKHTVYTSDVKYNDVNVFKCVRDERGRCLREMLVQREAEPIFLDWGSNASESSSGSEQGHSIESQGSSVQSVRRARARYARK